MRLTHERTCVSPSAFRVGLTGGIASGKSTAAKFFGALGVPILDSDQIARDVVEPGQPPLERLVERFGAKILTPDGHLDRPALRDIVFSDPKARADLEALTHPAIGAAMEARSAAAGGPYQVLRCIPRTTIDVDDGSPLPGKVVQQARPYGLDYLGDRLGVVIRR